MPWTNALLEWMGRRDYVPQTDEKLAEQLQAPASEKKAFRQDLKEMVRQGLAVRVKKNRYCLPADADLAAGVIHFRQSGAAYLILDAGKGKSPPRIRVRAENTGVAMHGDRVLARLVTERRRYRYRKNKHGYPAARPEAATGRVIRVLERARETLAGTLQRGRLFFYVIPDNPKITQDILVPDPALGGIRPPPEKGDKVLVRLAEWEHRHLNPQGEIVEALGRSHTPRAEYRALLHQYGLDPEFPAAAARQAAKLPKKVTAAQCRERFDLRHLYTITIDPDDAKDFDDALSLETLEDGTLRAGVHIADVGAYVKAGSALDEEARRRGNSTYLTGAVIPMFPRALSNGLCSLVEGEDRLTQTVFLHFTPKYRLHDIRFAETVIRSRKRLTYRQAYALLKQDGKEAQRIPAPPPHQTGLAGRALADLPEKEIRQLQKLLRSLWNTAAKLRQRRMAKGSLDLDMPEVKIFVDKEGYAARIEKVQNDESHQLIEEFMLAANEAVGRTLHQQGVPLIFRVHDKPDPEKLDDLRETLSAHGIVTGDLNQRREVTALLNTLKEHPQGHILRLQFLRSLSQACYRAQSDGHYGLNKKYYTHFTSPIRRYSDLTVHRMMRFYLAKTGNKKKNSKASVIPYQSSHLQSLARHLSRTEQNSTEAERDSIKIKLMEFFQRELAKKEKTAFEAVITDVKNHGFFVELTESLAYGLVHVSSIKDDLYQLSRDGSSLTGRRRRKKFHLGQTVQVEVESVDRYKRQIDFRLA